jgi:phage terminase large subunit-like protein
MDYIENFIEELGTKYNIREIAFDRWGAVQMIQNLDEHGLYCYTFWTGIIKT